MKMSVWSGDYCILNLLFVVLYLHNTVVRGGSEHSLACQGKTLHPHPVVCISCKDGLAACVIDFSLSLGSFIMLYLWILTHRWKTFCEMHFG